VCSIAQTEMLPPRIMPPTGNDMKTKILSWLFRLTEKQAAGVMGLWAMVSRDSILVWNRYVGARMKSKRLSDCLPDRYFNPFHLLGTVTGVTDMELRLL
jgi:hypothetical protein